MNGLQKITSSDPSGESNIAGVFVGEDSEVESYDGGEEILDSGKPDRSIPDEVKADIAADKKSEEAAAAKSKVTLAKKEAPAAKVEAPSSEVEDPTDPLGIKKQISSTITTAPAGVKRNYEGHTAEDVAILKQVPNAAFNYFDKTLRELRSKQQIQQVQDIWSHPKAYTLLEDYQTQISGYNSLSFEYDHMLSQSQRVEAGEPITVVMGFKEDGSPEYSEPFKVDKTRFNQTLFDAQFKLNERKSGLTSFQSTQAKKYQDTVGLVEAVSKQYFPWEADAKLLDSEKVLMGNKEVPYKNAREDFINKLIPDIFRAHPITKLASNLFLLSLIYGKKYQEAINGQQQQNLDADLKKMAEPTGQTTAGGSKEGEDKVLDFEIFE